MASEWFDSWFDTKYYHILYKNRNYFEAENFINQLIDFLNPKKGSIFLDIACGKGRHSKFIHNKGYEVVGFDLSRQSISYANKFKKIGLEFYTHDMRENFKTDYFDYALNLFTSFGYFKSKSDELKALKSSANNLKPKGNLVIDFLNKEQVISNLIPFETKKIENIQFLISKRIENNQVIKNIDFEDNGKKYSFQESVKLLGIKDFEWYLNEVGLKITNTFGSYNLDEYSDKSQRLIIIAEKVG